MLHRRWYGLSLILAMLPLAKAHGQTAVTPEERAVLAVVDTLLEAMSRRDVALSRRMLVPGASLHAIRDGNELGPARSQSDSAYLGSLASDTSALRERIWNPTTVITGTLAQLWAPYDFHVNRQFSHCGVDSFNLLKTASGWQVASVAYTVKRQGCEPSPLGPLGPAPDR